VTEEGLLLLKLYAEAKEAFERAAADLKDPS
jgi:hypothetical protein